MQVIGIDCGRAGLKAFSGSRRLFIPSVVGEWRQRRISEGGDYEVEIDGQKHFVGELAETESRFRREMVSENKIHDETKILTLAALAMLAAPGKDIRLITGLPVSHHIPATKQSYSRLLSGRYTVTVNGQQRIITLADNAIAVTIEGAGAYWSEALGGQKITGKCRIVDLGSRTINALTINSGRFADLDSFTLDYGCIELHNAGDNPDAAAAEQFARRIYADVSRRWLNQKDEAILLTGGGALLLEQWLRQHFKQARIIPDPVYANAIGYYRMGVQRWQKPS